MQATRCLQYKGFWGRSMDELKRFSRIAVQMEGIKGPQGPYELHDFRNPSSVTDCKVMSDKDMGGFSTAHLDWVVAPPPSPKSALPSPNCPGHARFHGKISTRLPPNRPDVKRSGYAGFRTKDRPPTIFGKSLWDIDPYIYLAVRVRSDGRSYFVNVQTESVIPTDLHQHRLFVRKPGEWETVLIKWNNFVRTNYGFAVEPQTEMLRQRVKSIGFGLTDRIPGPFALEVERIWATNDESEAEGKVSEISGVVSPAEEAEVEGEDPTEGGLRTKKGQKITWTT
ncbi:putative mitochondrial complex I intermediate-associated protein 30 precursor [Podospora australis]|uniref:Mitochondrial complex I intermediate-associated protein 30 n=1 Tax=Podospora australis TaxID=1536484 RepID=A0AAN6WVU2_9PEZI|nr:putative mitochondrial complex I intermediate-associated protein 30 precursor [Podospora australis]